MTDTDYLLVVTDRQLRDSRWRAVIWLIALNVIDVIATYTAIRWAGAHEANPIAKFMLDNYYVAYAKAAVLGFIVWGCTRKAEPMDLGMVARAWGAVGVYFLVVMLNMSTLIRAAF